MRTTGLVRPTHEPELRDVTINGEPRSVCTMRCAIRRGRGRDAGFIDVVAWGPLGRRCAEYLAAGSAAHVDGHLHQEEWTDADGRRHQRHRVVADDIQFLGRPDRTDGPILINGVEF